MPKKPSTLPSGLRATDVLTATQFAATFPIDSVNLALEQHERGTIRVRQLPNELVVYFVMMLSLFRDCSHKEVFRCVAVALNRLVGKSEGDVSIPSAAALSKARDRVGSEPLETLFHQFAQPLGQAGQKGIWYRRWRKIAIDGSLLETDATPANRQYFGSPTNQHQTVSRSPQTRLVSLMEIGTHLFFGAAIGSYYDGEVRLAEKLVPLLRKDMICIADRNFFGFKFFNEVSKTGAALLIRIQRGMSYTSEKMLCDGSHLITIHACKDAKRANGLKARLIQYDVIGAKKREPIYLVTNILEPEEAPAQELAALYHERWEIESALDELKTHLNAKALVLRSKTPKLVLQELWGMLMTHYVIRKAMYEAASHADLDPDELSFIHSVRVIKRALVSSTGDFFP
jgi:hypothetical protein